MFDKFSDDARRIIVVAQEQARLLGDDYVGAEHLLIAVLHGCAEDPGSPAAQALAQLGIEPSDAIRRLDLTPVSGNRPEVERLPFTKEAKDTLGQALRESAGDPRITPDHVLLALLRVGSMHPDTELAGALTTLDVSYTDLRRVLTAPTPPP